MPRSPQCRGGIEDNDVPRRTRLSGQDLSDDCGALLWRIHQQSVSARGADSKITGRPNELKNSRA